MLFIWITLTCNPTSCGSFRTVQQIPHGTALVTAAVDRYLVDLVWTSHTCKPHTVLHFSQNVSLVINVVCRYVMDHIWIRACHE